MGTVSILILMVFPGALWSARAEGWSQASLLKLRGVLEEVAGIGNSESDEEGL